MSLTLRMLAMAAAIALPATPALATPAAEAAKTQILTADKAFADRATAAGFSQALAEFMDPKDGLQFDPGADPTRGAAAIAAHAKPFDGMGVMSWAPSEAFAAAAGDMGMTWGRWRIQPGASAPKAAKVITGRYVIVWRKDSAGAWKGLVDIGNPD